MGAVVGRPGPLLVGDELWFYYWGTKRSERFKTEGIQRQHLMHIGLATLRRDGFVSLDAGQEPGTVITRPLTFTGHTLFVNAEVGDGGSVKVAVLGGDGQPIDGYALDDSKPLCVDTSRGRMAWHGADQVKCPPDGHVRLKFQLQDAKLYSFWIE